ncbi:hypothetical protein CF327_g969 [Tilletia walkeri]|uniref:Uncharacterized protein n=1 Tax=Tilletia walkeri TaxID=117179 RepID=A0A8X7N9I5_9BASI|nr:hypothetical protein CF327_g969 [Tilletia walkeri]KAE8268125.1 hypothetical protein A4X09_0g4209 [Tilletia walkeri]
MRRRQKAAAARPAPAAGASAAAPTWTPAKIVEVATRVRKNTHDAIVKQMKWQPTCRKGTTKWSISVLASAPEVMKAALGLPANEKEFKLKKLTMDEFERAFGTIHVSIRYGSLYVTGKTVTLRWDPSSCEFTLNGTYGLPQ